MYWAGQFFLAKCLGGLVMCSNERSECRYSFSWFGYNSGGQNYILKIQAFDILRSEYGVCGLDGSKFDVVDFVNRQVTDIILLNVRQIRVWVRSNYYTASKPEIPNGYVHIEQKQCNATTILNRTYIFYQSIIYIIYRHMEDIIDTTYQAQSISRARH